MLRFGVLGPLQVERDGVLLPDLAPRLQAVLAALLVDAGRPVAFDVVLDRVWGDDAAGPLTTLQAAVSKLRRVLEPDAAGEWTVLTTGPAGYVLRVAPEQVDALEFGADLARARSLAAAGEAGPARQAVGEGLARWRGPAYAGVPMAFAVEEAARLSETRDAALELAAELDLQLGRHAELAQELPALVRAHPLRERLRACLVLALYRCGRQADALAVYAETRELLADELGVDPSRELQELYAAVLRQDPALDLPATVDLTAAPEPPAGPALPPLPAALTRFLGRDGELAALDGALSTRRLVSLVGPGGSGKTRLALQAARASAAAGTPVCLVELAGTDDGGFVPAQVGAALGIGLTVGDPLDAVVTALAGRRLLLVLDNCEHLVDAAADACVRLLSRAPELTVLATSREPLGVPGEAVVPLGPMSVDGPDSEAVRLFLDRAAMVAPSLADPSPADLELVRQVVAELDGLPLAVELAAACLSTLPLAEVAARVNDRFTLLTGGFRGAPPHQRTLAATVRWSVDLLPPADRDVFSALSVFHGSFGADAVEAVLEPGTAALPALRTLVAGSLVTLEHRTGRYRLLQTLRQFGAEALDEGTRSRLRDRHAAFLVGLVERLEPTLRRHDAAASWQRLDLEQQDLRAALAHCLATGDAGTALRIGACLSWWWFRRGHVQEGRQWLAAALAARPEADPAVVARARFGLATLAYLQGDMETVRAEVDEVVALPRGVDDGLLALALVLRGFVRSLLGQEDFPGQAAQQAQRGIEIAAECGVDWVQAEIGMTLGQIARASGDAAAALDHLARAAEVAEQVGHTWARVSAGWVRAKVLVDLGEGAAALRSLAEVHEVLLAESDSTTALAVLLTAAGAATAVGRAEAAATLLGACASLGRSIGYDPLRMDPQDGRRYEEATRGALTADRFAAAYEAGERLDLPAASRLLAELADPVLLPVR